jgi:pimeloyl-ACP methyl ester carboxylesterase
MVESMSPRLRWIAVTLVLVVALAAVAVTTLVLLGRDGGDTGQRRDAAPTARSTPSTSPTDVTTVPLLNNPGTCPDAVGFTCSTLTVPVDHDDPTGDTLDLAVATGDNQDAPRGVLLFLAGGPGQAGVPLVSRIAQQLGSLLDEYQLVMLDQRGTGATALDCPDLQDQLGSSDLWVPTDEAVTSCATALGDDRRFYGTGDTVADLELLRQALDVDDWAIDGVSYGTFVAEQYTIAYPDAVNRLVLDSVVPHAGVDPFLRVPMRATGRVLSAVCRQSTCAGNPVADLRSTLARRDDGSDILDTITAVGIVDPNYGGVPAVLRASARGNDRPLDRLLSAVRRGVAADEDELSQGLHASTLCADIAWPWRPTDDAAARAAAVRRAAGTLRPADVAPFDVRTATTNGLLATCEQWPPGEVTAVQRPDQFPDVPTLLLGGDRDLSTPLEWLRQQAAVTPDATVVVVRGAGHSVQTRAADDRGRQAVARFLRAEE